MPQLLADLQSAQAPMGNVCHGPYVHSREGTSCPLCPPADPRAVPLETPPGRNLNPFHPDFVDLQPALERERARADAAEAARDKAERALRQERDRYENAQCVTCATHLDAQEEPSK